MSGINEIVSKEAIKGFIDLDNAITKADNGMEALFVEIKNLKDSIAALAASNADSTKKTEAYAAALAKAQTANAKLTAKSKEYAEQQKKIANAEALSKQRSAAYTKQLLEQEKAAKIATAAEAKRAKEIQSNKDALAKQRSAAYTKQLLEQEKAAKLTAKSQALINERLKAGVKDAATITLRYKNLSDELNKQRNLAKDLGIVYGRNSKQYKAVAKDVKKLDKEFKALDSDLGQSQRKVGQYGDAMGGLSPKLGGMISMIKQVGVAMKTLFLNPVGLVIAAVVALGAVVVMATKQAKEYQAANAELAGVLGVTRAETLGLQKESQRLGATTAFTANEVTGLQIEYARLGFAEQSIKDVTESTINLSIAAKSGAEETAAFVGSTIRGFGLSAEEAARVSDVAAKSFSSSALDFNKLNTSLSAAAPAAKASGKSLEFTIARLGKLSDAGLDASTAGTSLRNIFLDLSKKGLTYDQAMEKINKSTDKNVTAMDLFGKRGAVSALILAEQSESAKELEKSLEGAGGTAKKVADEQLNTLDGSLKLLGSAWSGMLFSVEDGEGIFIKAAKGIVDYVTWFITKLTVVIEKLSTAFNFVIFVFKDVKEAVQPFIDTLQTKLAPVLDKISGAIGKLKGFMSNLFGGDEAEKGASKVGKYWDKFKKAQAEAEIETEKAKEKEVQTKVALDVELLTLEKQKQEALLKEHKKGIAERERLNKILLDIEKQGKADMIDLEKDFQDELTQELEDSHEEGLAILDADFAATVSAKQRLYEKERNIIALTSKSKEEEAQRIAELDNGILSNQINNLKNRLSTEELTMVQRGALKEKLAKLEQDLDNQTTDQTLDNLERQKQKRAEITQGAVDITNAFFDYKSAKIDGELEELEAKNEAGELSDTEYQKKKAELELKAAKNERTKALFNVAINTAMAVSGAVAASPVTFGLPFSAFALATGALQAAAILAKPLPEIPAFADGTMSAPSKFIAGEAGRELIFKRSGEVEMATQATLYDNNSFKGATILPNAVTEHVISQTKHNGFSSPSRSDKAIISELSKINKSIKNNKTPIIDNGRVIGIQTANSRQIYLNKKLNG